MISTTRRANDLLAFLVKYKEAHGTSPSFDEMMEALGLRSKSGIHRILEQLVERGRIRRLPARARAIEIVPDDYFAIRVDPSLWGPLLAAARDCGMSIDRFVNDQIAVMVSA